MWAANSTVSYSSSSSFLPSSSSLSSNALAAPVARFTVVSEQQGAAACCAVQQEERPHRHQRRMMNVRLLGLVLSPAVWEQNCCSTEAGAAELTLTAGNYSERLVLSFAPVAPASSASGPFEMRLSKRDPPLQFDETGVPTVMLQVFGKSKTVVALRVAYYVDEQLRARATERFQLLRKVADPVDESGRRNRRAHGAFRTPTRHYNKRKPQVDEAALFGQTPDVVHEAMPQVLLPYEQTSAFRLGTSPVLEHTLFAGDGSSPFLAALLAPSASPLAGLHATLPMPASPVLGFNILSSSPSYTRLASPAIMPPLYTPSPLAAGGSGLPPSLLHLARSNSGNSGSNSGSNGRVEAVRNDSAVLESYDHAHLDQLNDVDIPSAWMYPQFS